MRIGIDLYSFIPRKNFGVGPTNYAYSLVRRLVEGYPEHTFVLFVNNGNADYFMDSANCEVVISKMPASKGVLRVIHEQIVLPFYFYKKKLDVIHFTGNVISFLLYRRAVFTVHDLMWKYYSRSNWVPLYKKIYYSTFCPLSFRLARYITTASDFVKKELVFRYGIKAGKIIVIPHGAYTQVLEITAEKKKKLREEYGEGYLFTVTTTWPHKNLINLLKAYVLLLQKHPDFKRRLIVIGQKNLKNKEIAEFIKENNLSSEQVLFLGYADDDVVCYLYGHASVMIFPSLYEGFGVPPLEAMKFGVPVVAANAASLPEVGADACLYAEPESPTDLSGKIMQILTDEKLRVELVEKGRGREAQFSLKKTAEATFIIYSKFALRN